MNSNINSFCLFLFFLFALEEFDDYPLFYFFRSYSIFKNTPSKEYFKFKQSQLFHLPQLIQND